MAVVLVGTKGDSATYVRMKRKACADLGIQSFSTDLPGDVSEEDLLKVPALASFPPCSTPVESHTVFEQLTLQTFLFRVLSILLLLHKAILHPSGVQESYSFLSNLKFII